MNNGIFKVTIHGWINYFKIEENIVYIPDLVKGKPAWTKTVVDRSRLDEFKYVMMDCIGSAEPCLNLQRNASKSRLEFLND